LRIYVVDSRRVSASAYFEKKGVTNMPGKIGFSEYLIDDQVTLNIYFFILVVVVAKYYLRSGNTY